MKTTHNRIHRLLIANRSEVAARIQATAQKLGIETVCVYAEDDTDQEHLAYADATYPLSGTGDAAYLNQQELIAIARQSGANAIHPGYGFLSEVASFARATVNADLIFVGPNANIIEQLGDKGQARNLAEECDVPVVPGQTFRQSALKQAHAYAATIGYPVLIKATGGGGGRGMARVNNDEEFPIIWQRIADEGVRAFLSRRIVVEKYIEHPRHIEVQIAGDGKHMIHLFERDCSTQRRRQKIIEEAPAAHLSPTLRTQLLDAALRLGTATGYDNIGTVEFIVTPDEEFYFLEVNTRLQVEHGVTEMITGVDLVALQLHLAQYQCLPYEQKDISERGHAIQCRIYAEDPTADFTPVTGTIFAQSATNLPFTRISHSISLPHRVSGLYDPMVSKVLAHGATRNEALATLKHLLAHYRLSGITTNIAFLRHVLAHPLFAQATVSTQSTPLLLETFAPPKQHVTIDAAVLSTALLTKHSPPKSVTQSASWKASSWK